MLFFNFLKKLYCNKTLFPQCIAASGVILLLLEQGALFAWTSPYTLRLMASDELGMKINTDQASWVGSWLNLGRFLGALIGTACLYFLGSKTSVLLSFIPITLCWTIKAFANTVISLYYARVIGGLGSGMTYTSFPLFIGEIALPSNRGAIFCATFVGVNFSIVVASALGTKLSIQMFSIILLVPCIIGICIMLYLPNTPHYLLKIEKKEAAKKSLEWYRGGCDDNKEFEEIETYVNAFNSDSFSEKMKILAKPFVLKALFIVTTVNTLICGSGLNSLLMYAESVLKSAKLEIINPTILITTAGVVTTVISVVTIFLIDEYGRKFLLILSNTGLALSMILLGTHFLLLREEVNHNKLQWLPIISFYGFESSLSFGLTVPSALKGEMFPSNVKFITSCIISLAGALASFVFAKSYHPAVEVFGEDIVFYFHAFLALLCILFTIFMVPETKNKSLQQIQEELMNKKTQKTIVV